MSVIDTATNTVVATIRVGAQPRGWRSARTAPAPTSPTAAPDSVSVIDTATNTVIATIPVGGQPWAVAVSPDGTRAYVTNREGTVSVIDTATNTVTATIPVGPTAFGVAVSPDGTRAYVTNGGATRCR